MTDGCIFFAMGASEHVEIPTEILDFGAAHARGQAAAIGGQARPRPARRAAGPLGKRKFVQRPGVPDISIVVGSVDGPLSAGVACWHAAL